MRNLLSLIVLATFASLPANIRAADAQPAKASDVGAPLSLRDALLRLENESADIKKAQHSLDAARAVERQAFSGLLPEIKIDVTAGTFHDRTPTEDDLVPPPIPRDRNDYNGSVTLTQPIFAGFSSVAALEAGSAGTKSAQNALSAAEQDAIYTCIDLYFGIQQKSLEKASQEEIKSLRELRYRETADRAREGRALELDSLQAEYDLKSSGPAIMAISREIEQRSLQLAQVLNVPLDTPLKLTDSLDNAKAVLLKTPLPPLKDALEIALHNNPDILKAMADRDSESASASVTLAKHLPSLDFVVNAGEHSSRRDEIGTQDATNYGGFVRLTVPLFSGLNSFSEREEHKAKVMAAAMSEQLVREKVLRDLHDAYRAYELSREQMDAEDQNVKVAQKSVTRAQAMYRNGTATLSTVLDSYSRLLDARKLAAQSVYDQAMAIAKVKRQMGNLTL